MYFTLFYRGPLKSNGRPNDKHTLRAHFHSQLKYLWSQPPLVAASRLLDPEVGDLSILRQREGFQFAPLIAQSVGLVAELDIFLLWPSTAGQIVTKGGDIDNRLKTLLDALKYPSEPGSLPANAKPTHDQQPFFCLLEDDSLITRLNVETDRLLEPAALSIEVMAVIRVQTKQMRGDFRLHPLVSVLA